MKNISPALTLIDKYLVSKLDWTANTSPLDFMTRLQQEMSPDLSWEAARSYWIEGHIQQTADHWLDFLWDQYKLSTQQQNIAA
jgi:hypothetical protein